MTRKCTPPYAQDNLPEIVRQMDKGDLWDAIQEFRAVMEREGLYYDGVFDNVRDRSPGREIEL